MTPDQRAERLLTKVGLPLIHDMREDVAAAHRVISHLDRCDLEALTCILAALVPVDTPVSHLAWWRLPLAAESGDQPCGTRAAAARHRWRNEPLCRLCDVADRAYQQGIHARRRAS